MSPASPLVGTLLPGERVAVDGGEFGVRSRDGKALFYLESNRLMAVPVSTQGMFSFGAAKPLFTIVSHASAGTSAVSRYETLPDGRFAVLEPIRPPGANPPSIHIVVNLPALLRQAQGEMQPRNAGE